MTSPISLRPEDELLCLACGPPGEAQTEQARLMFQSSLDWDYLLESARRHRVQPLLFYNLKTVQPEKVPSQFLTCLKEEFLANAWLNRLHSQELVKLVESFEANKIRVMALKGVALAVAIYGDLALRKVGDLDLLVSEEDFQHAAQLLKDQGYRSIDVTPPEAADNRESFHDELFLKKDKGCSIAVDLHRHIVPAYISFSLDFESLWERHQRVQLGDSAVASLSPNDLLLYLCVHGARHAWPNLRSLTDVAELIRTYQAELDWTEILERAEAYRNRRMFLVGVSLVSDLLNVKLPEFVVHKAESDRAIRTLTRHIRDRLFAKKEASSLAEVLERSAFRLRTMDTIQDRLRYIGYHIRLKAKAPL